MYHVSHVFGSSNARSWKKSVITGFSDKAKQECKCLFLPALSLTGFSLKPYVCKYACNFKVKNCCETNSLNCSFPKQNPNI